MAIALMGIAVMRGRRTIRLAELWLLAWIVSAPICWASLPPGSSWQSNQGKVSIAVFHHSEMDRSTVEVCEASKPPEALATPDPLLNPFGPGSRVAVSFVVGIDGRVHSPVILESAGSAEDGRILQALRFWRYRPATCNAAPTEMESKVEFSSR